MRPLLFRTASYEFHLHLSVSVVCFLVNSLCLLNFFTELRSSFHRPWPYQIRRHHTNLGSPFRVSFGSFSGFMHCFYIVYMACFMIRIMFTSIVHRRRLFSFYFFLCVLFNSAPVPLSMNILRL